MLITDFNDFLVEILVKKGGVLLMMTLSDASMGSSIFSLYFPLGLGEISYFLSLALMMSFLDGFLSNLRAEPLLWAKTSKG